MKHKRIVFIIVGSIILGIIVTFVLLQRYLKIVNYPLNEIECAYLRFYDGVNGELIERKIEDKQELELIYSDLKDARVSIIRFGGRDESGSDFGWSLIMKYRGGSEVYDYDKEIRSVEHGCRKYITGNSNGTVDGMLIISARKLVEDINGRYFYY
ncbi:MAG: hypothetical protein K6E53_13750 [Lachnospiraceae bacterium]|nr:hypothetical protein [Lachnospiraceae bacterium]